MIMMMILEEIHGKDQARDYREMLSTKSGTLVSVY